MNKAQLFAGVVGVFAAASVMAQGTIDFSNIKTAGRPKIFDKDGTTALAGANFLVDILVKNPASGNYEGVNKSTGAAFTGSSFLTGANAGLFSGGNLVVPFLAPDAKAEVIVRAWDVTSGASYASALYKNEISFSIDKLGGSGQPPSLPAVIANFKSFALVPEPSTYALAALGLGGLLLFRRK
jgi:hypothetical protein